MLGRYRVKEVLARGRLGTVYRAHDEDFRFDVALKALERSLAPDGETRGGLVRRLRKLRPVEHRHVVRLFDAHDDGERCVLSAQLVEGLPLRRLLRTRQRKGRRFAAHELRPVLSQIAAGLAGAHAAEAVHGALRAEDLLLLPDHLKIAGVGVVGGLRRDAVLRAYATVPRGLLAPELRQGGELTPRTDVYALGALLYELATGTSPEEDRVSVEEHGWPRALDGPIEGALAEDPAERYEHVGDFVVDAHKALEASGTAATAARPRTRSPVRTGPLTAVGEPRPRGPDRDVTERVDVPDKLTAVDDESEARERAEDLDLDARVDLGRLGGGAEDGAREPSPRLVPSQNLTPESASEAAPPVVAARPSPNLTPEPAPPVIAARPSLNLTPSPAPPAAAAVPPPRPVAPLPARRLWLAVVAPVAAALVLGGVLLATRATRDDADGELRRALAEQRRLAEGLRTEIEDLKRRAPGEGEGAAGGPSARQEEPHPSDQAESAATLGARPSSDPSPARERTGEAEAGNAGDATSIDAPPLPPSEAVDLRCPSEMSLVATRRSGRRVAEGYCVDRYEYPGKGARPRTEVTWEMATVLCRARHARLCARSEWTRACRGRGGADYPYGRVWDADTCGTQTAQGYSRSVAPAGSFRACRSAERAYDMSGNVAEWVEEQVVMGGAVDKPDYATRCSSEAPGARSPLVGFRCCGDPTTEVKLGP